MCDSTCKNARVRIPELEASLLASMSREIKLKHALAALAGCSHGSGLDHLHYLPTSGGSGVEPCPCLAIAKELLE